MTLKNTTAGALANALVDSARPKTLLVSIAVILLGQSLAWNDLQLEASLYFFSSSTALFCFLSCGFLQISVNLANDYFDGKAGIDQPSRLGPIRPSQAGTLSHQHLLTAIIGSSLIAVISGLYLVYLGGWLFLLLGFLSLAGVYSYSGGRTPLASNALGELAVFLFFGWLAVMASYYLQTFNFKFALFFPASEIGLLVAAIMLVNNIRDISTDQRAGKVTLAVRLGREKSSVLYCLCLLLPFLSIPFNPYFPWLNTVLFPLHFYLCWVIRKRSGSRLNTQLAQTSLVVLLWAVGYLASFILSPVF